MKRYIAMVAMAVALLAAQPAFAEFKIAWAGPSTGGTAAVGLQHQHGASQAVADINAAGGILGEQITLVLEDDAGDPRQAVSVANRIATSGIQFVVGHGNSANSIAASEVYADSGIFEISPSSTNPVFTERGLWNVFRTCGRDDQQGIVAGRYLVQNYAGMKVFVVHDKTQYGRGLVDEVKKVINAGGLTEIAFEGINAGEKDYSALVSKIKSLGADVVYYGGNYTEAGLLLRQMRDQGVQAPMIGGDSVLAAEFPAIAGPEAEGTLITFAPDATKNPIAKAIVDRMAANGVSAEGFTLYGYAAVQVIALAIEATGKADPKAVADYIHSGVSFDTVIGPLSYDEKGDVKRLDFVFYALTDGKFQEVAR
jgi:branched-chain amino acid transport system substrate-binding protein